MKKTYQLLNIFGLVAVLIVNYLSNTGAINGETMATVSVRYHNLFTPAGYAFAIWGIIYLGMAGFVIYYGRSLFKKDVLEDDTVKEVGPWFFISCVANMAWVFFWLYDFTLLSVVVIIILLFALIQIIFRTGMELYNVPILKFLFLWWPFCLYSGWVSVALIANVAAYLTKIEWSRFGFSETFWAVIMVLIPTVISIIIIWNRNMREYGLAIIWGLVAIAVANQDQDAVVVWTAIIGAVIIFLNVSIHGFQNRKENPFFPKRYK